MDWTPSLIALCVGAAAVLLVGGGAIRAIKRLGLQSDVREDTPERHQKKAGTPSMGGLFLIPAALIGMLVVDRSPLTLGIALFAVAFGALGFVDDFAKARRGQGRGLRAREKLLAQCILGIGMAAYALHVLGREPVIRILGLEPIELGSWVYLIGVGFSICVSNAFNLTDGLDGLASGTLIPVTLAVAGMAVPLAAPGTGPIGAAIAGACAGFLWFNRHPARVWMGDTGSMGLGGAMAALAVLGGLEWFITVAGAVFLAEMASVMLQVASFKLTGRRVFKMSPLHHHFELCGMGERTVVAGFWVASIVASSVAVLIAWRVNGP